MLKQLFALTLLCFLALGTSAQFSFVDRSSEIAPSSYYSGNAVTIHDVNSDGLDDIVILDDAKNLRILFQQLDGNYSLYTGGSLNTNNSWGMVVGDLDNNGHSDVVSGISFDEPDLAMANANGTDWDISKLEGYSLFYQGSCMGDVDGDGDLDVYVCADTDESAIWENDGNGGMTYSENSLIDLSAIGWDGSGNYGSNFTDYDLDGDLDLYVSHCRQGVTDPADPRRINQLFENDGNNNYTENAAAYGLALGTQTWTSDFGDIDNDGDFDIIQTNHDVNNMLLENLDDSDQYADIFDAAIGTQDVGLPIQSVFKDFDNDGFLDLLITGTSHALYHNNGDMTFTLQANAFPGEGITSLAVGDLNHDGFLDVYASYCGIYNNPSNTADKIWINEGNDNLFLTVALEGTITNQDAIGAQVRAYGPWGVQVREVRAGESYGINNSLHCHFGLGANEVVDSLAIFWPTSGINQVMYDVPADQFLSVIENECVAPLASITSDGPTVICPGETITLTTATGANLSYAWSTGETTSTITTGDEGIYTVSVTDNNTGCSAISASIHILVSPDETPLVMSESSLEFCEGESIVLSSSDANSYAWSTGETTQSITVSQAGDYSVTVPGACADWTSELVSIVTQPTPVVTPDETVVGIATGTAANLLATSTGDEVRWYDMAEAGSLLSIGDSYTTPVLNNSTSYWAEAVNILGGGSGTGGKTDNSNGEYFASTERYLYFDAYQDFIIDAVKVYADQAGERSIGVYDLNGTLLTQTTVNIAIGSSVVELGLFVEAGEGYSLRTTGLPGLWRDNDPSNVNYPYPLATYGSITGANVGAQVADDYYYFYYDWQVSLPQSECISDREEVVVEIVNGVSEANELEGVSVYPNPTQGIINVVFTAQNETEVQIELTDLSGKLIEREQWNDVRLGAQHSVDLSALSPGMYLLKIQSERGQSIQRIELK